jgi:hypothetical protein
VVIMKGRVFSIDVFMIWGSPTFGPAVSVGRTTPCIRGGARHANNSKSDVCITSTHQAMRDPFAQQKQRNYISSNIQDPKSSPD